MTCDRPGMGPGPRLDLVASGTATALPKAYAKSMLFRPTAETLRRLPLVNLSITPLVSQSRISAEAQ